MVCLWPMYGSMSVRDECQAFCRWIIHKQQTKLMCQPQTVFENLVQQFIICHVNLYVGSLVYLSLEVQSVIAAWYGGGERERDD